MAKKNTAEGYTTSPTTVIAGNSGGGSGDSITTVSAGAGGTIQAINTDASHGQWCYLLTPASGASNYILMSETGSTTGASVSVDTKLSGYPSSETNFINPQTAAGAAVAYLNLTAAGKWKLSHTAGTLYTFTNSVPLAWATTTIFYTIAAGTASVQAKMYDAAGTLIEASPAYTTGNTGTTAVGRVIIGKFTATGTMAPYKLDNIKFNFSSATEYPLSTVPTANAGSDQSVASGATVTLNGSASADTNGTIAAYNWTQVSGTTVTLSGTGSNRTFTAPGSSGTLVFGLTVTDDDGDVSTQDTVSIVVTAPSNVAPTANAGPDQINIEPYATVTLTGSASTDSDGTISSYTWSQISGTSVTLSGSGANRTFSAPNVAGGVTLVFGLVVTDNGGLDSTQDTVSITILPPTELLRLSGAWVGKTFRKRVSGAWL